MVEICSQSVGFSIAVVDDVFYAIGCATTSYPVPIFSFPYGPSIKQHATNEQYFPFNYGTPDSSYDGTPPKIEITSIKQETYYQSNISLNFVVNETVSSMNYVLDNSKAVQIQGNTTLSNLSFGAHNITIYATDTAGNTGASYTVNFIVADSTSTHGSLLLPLILGTIAILTVTIVCVGLIYYLKKRKREHET